LIFNPMESGGLAAVAALDPPIQALTAFVVAANRFPA
jgi:hypothetical protein